MEDFALDIIRLLYTSLRDKEKKIAINNTIFNATENRQKSCKETARQVDLMLILGDSQSSVSYTHPDVYKRQT